tara:strand:+ start:115 stop:441 length:327 start_codon:yes stop_codon:yes gene_type:complete
MNQISSSIAYLESKESAILPTKFESLAQQVKEDIENNLFGSLLVFPEPKRRANRNPKLSHMERVQTVNAVNRLRSQGKTSQQACDAVGVTRSSYGNWSLNCMIKRTED